MSEELPKSVYEKAYIKQREKFIESKGKIPHPCDICRVLNCWTFYPKRCGWYSEEHEEINKDIEDLWSEWLKEETIEYIKENRKRLEELEKIIAEDIPKTLDVMETELSELKEKQKIGCQPVIINKTGLSHLNKIIIPKIWEEIDEIKKILSWQGQFTIKYRYKFMRKLREEHKEFRKEIDELKEVVRELYIELGKESKLKVSFINEQLEKLGGETPLTNGAESLIHASSKAVSLNKEGETPLCPLCGFELDHKGVCLSNICRYHKPEGETPSEHKSIAWFPHDKVLVSKGELKSWYITAKKKGWNEMATEIKRYLTDE